MKRLWQAIVPVLLVVVALFGSAASASASRKPTTTERTRLVTVVRHYVDTSNCCAVMRKIKILDVAVSTVDSRWAYVGIEGYDQSGTDIGAATAVLHRGYLTGTWSVRAFGTGQLGCPAPTGVRHDLHLTC